MTSTQAVGRPVPSRMPEGSRRSVLVVDDRPGTFTDRAYERTDVDVVLLRFTDQVDPEQRRRTSHLPTFEVAADESDADAVQRYLAFAAELPHPPTYFCNPHEPLQERAQAFAASAGLPHLTPLQVERVRKKPAMKARYAELGLRCAAFSSVASADEVAAFAEVHGWPVVVKPTDSFACIDTYRVEGPEQIPDLHPGREWTVEEFIRGREFQLCALVLGGRVTSAYLSLNPRPILEVLDGAMNANVTFARGEAHPFDEVAVCQQLVDAFEIDHGYFHGECWVTSEGEFVMGEVAARISGCEVPENHGRAYGWDVHTAILDSYLGLEPTTAYTRDRSVGDLLLPTGRGVVTDVSSWDDLASLPGVTGGRIKVSVGDELDPPRASMASSGYVHVEGEDVAQVIRRMQVVLDHYVIEIDGLQATGAVA